MASSRRRLISAILGVFLGLFFVADLVAGALSSDELALNAALATCREKGWREGALAVSKSEISGLVLGKTARIELKTKDAKHPKTIHVTLRKPINLLAWRVIEYNEAP